MVNQSATNTFRKRSYKFTEFAHDVFGLVPALPNFTAVYALPGRMDKRFREKIMLSVSRMNDCRHCTAIHGAWAALAGLSGEDRAALHELDPADMDHRDWVALEYARRVAADAPAEPDLEAELSAKRANLESRRGEIESQNQANQFNAQVTDYNNSVNYLNQLVKEHNIQVGKHRELVVQRQGLYKAIDSKITSL